MSTMLVSLQCLPTALLSWRWDDTKSVVYILCIIMVPRPLSWIRLGSSVSSASWHLLQLYFRLCVSLPAGMSWASRFCDILPHACGPYPLHYWRRHFAIGDSRCSALLILISSNSALGGRVLMGLILAMVALLSGRFGSPPAAQFS